MSNQELSLFAFWVTALYCAPERWQDVAALLGDRSPALASRMELAAAVAQEAGTRERMDDCIDALPGIGGEVALATYEAFLWAASCCR